MAEEEGFEPPRLLHPFGFQDRPLQPGLGIPPKIWWSRAGSNCRHMDFQSIALPAELPDHIFFINKLAVSTGLEPAISSVTDWHVNHYTTRPLMVAEVRLELTTSGL